MTIEPTEAQIEAAVAAAQKAVGNDRCCIRGIKLDTLFRDSLRAALNAAPEPTLPCEVMVGAVRFNAGVKISTMLAAIERQRARLGDFVQPDF